MNDIKIILENFTTILSQDNLQNSKFSIVNIYSKYMSFVIDYDYGLLPLLNPLLS